MAKEMRRRFTNQSRSSASKGLTMLELIIVLSIISVTLAIGTPSFVSMLNRGAHVSAVNNIITGIHAARNHATSYKRTFVLEPIDGDWTNGYHLKPTNIVSESVLDFEFPEDTKIKIAVNPDIGFISFDRLGRAQPANLVFEICNEDSGLAANIDMSIFGNAVVRRVNGDMEQVACVMN